MGSHSLYNLTWGEYGTSLVSAVQLLRCHEELVDVTLAAGGRTFHAHKVVLCAASPFLMDLLKSTSCKHPVVMLAGVQASDLEALLEFVYKGEVSIDPNQLPSLLQAAHCLNIQGLSPSNNVVNSEHTHQTKLEKIEVGQQSHVEIPFQESDIPVKRKKKVKRLLKSPTTSSSVSKWSKVYIQTEPNENVILSGQQDDTCTSSWTQHINIGNVSTSATTLDSLPIQSPILVQNLPVNISSCTTSCPKVKGASDQPGTCPLCGAMLRQARNLRRHLITSCKYRLVNSTNQSTASTSSSSPTSQVSRVSEGNLHQLQTISLHNTDRITQSALERLENKPMALTPISCSELLPTSSNLITMQNSPLQ